MVVVEYSSGEQVLFAFVFSKLKREWAISATFSVRFGASVSRFSFLASIAVQNIYTITVRIEPLGPL